jgi:hypothetical protein
LFRPLQLSLYSSAILTVHTPLKPHVCDVSPRASPPLQ